MMQRKAFYVTTAVVPQSSSCTTGLRIFSKVGNLSLRRKTFTNNVMAGLCKNIDGRTVGIKASRKLIFFHRRSLQGDGTNRYTVDDTDYSPHIIFTRLNNGEEYVVDISGAQFGQYRAVMPYEEYRESYIVNVEKELSYQNHLAFVLLEFNEASSRAWSLQERGTYELLAQQLDETIIQWKGEKGTRLRDIFQQNSVQVESFMAGLLAMLRDKLLQHANFQNLLRRIQPNILTLSLLVGYSAACGRAGGKMSLQELRNALEPNDIRDLQSELVGDIRTNPKLLEAFEVAFANG